MKLADIDPSRFWTKVDKRGPDECWLWTAGTSTCNPRYTPMTYGAYKQTRAHRAAWALANGRVPRRGFMICHRCDVPLCCNPSHLYEGTRADNQRDMQTKLRSGILGEKNPKAKITPEIVRQIRAETATHESVGRKYGLHGSHVARIRSRQKWRHVQ